MNTDSPPPRLAPDRPSDAAIAQAFREMEPNGFIIADIWKRRVIERADELDATRPIEVFDGWGPSYQMPWYAEFAAPPPEAPGEVQRWDWSWRGHDVGQMTRQAEGNYVLHADYLCAINAEYTRGRNDGWEAAKAAAPAAPAPDTAGATVFDDRVIVADMLRQYAAVLESGELDGAGHAYPAAIIEQAELLEAAAAPRVTGGREAEFVVELLIEAGHVPRGRVSQARAIAKNAAIQAATGGEVGHEG